MQGVLELGLSVLTRIIRITMSRVGAALSFHTSAPLATSMAPPRRGEAGPTTASESRRNLMYLLPRALFALLIAAAPLPAVQAQTPAEILRHHAELVLSAYRDAHAGALKLRDATQALITAPSSQTLADARQAWLQARESYGQTEAFRFYGGPIDGESGPEGRINAWPMDESYVDYVDGNPQAGLIQKRKQAITSKVLAALNERGGEENIATGWHAIEFLLWGQDRSVSGPGDRPYTDFSNAANADRRRQYLQVVTQLLVDDLAGLIKAWAPGVRNNYRASFERGGMRSLRKVWVGIGSLSRGELAGERLEVALASQDQEDEHSCFSDNTNRDVVNNARGIENVWLGSYRRTDGSLLVGPGLRDLVASKDAVLAERTTKQIRTSVLAAEAIPAPFDQAIRGDDSTPGRQAILKAVSSLTQQSKDLVDAAAAVGLKQLNLVRP